MYVDFFFTYTATTCIYAYWHTLPYTTLFRSIVSAMVLSVFVALILSPALCATMLKRTQDHHESFLARRFPRIGEWGTTAADKFNHGFERMVDRYQGAEIGRAHV